MALPLIVITGASSGIGAATARLLSAQGHPLLLLARRLELLEELGLPDTLCRKVDVTDRAAVEEAVREAEARFGPVDALVNNAGTMLLGRIADQPVDEWDLTPTALRERILATLEPDSPVAEWMLSFSRGTHTCPPAAPTPPNLTRQQAEFVLARAGL